MNEHVHVSLVFSSGQKLSVRLPREVAQSAESFSERHLAFLIEKTQQAKMAARQDGAYPS